MIRLGSLAGYAFEGPRVLASWPAPAVQGVYAVLYRPDAETRPEHYAVLYVDHAADLSRAGLPFTHPRSSCWIERAGSKWRLFIAHLELHGALESHRVQIVEELASVYHPGCNATQFERSWKGEWIGQYSAPTTGPLTTGRDVDV